MRTLPAIICLTLNILLGSVGVSASADLQKGVVAFMSGDYATALREWKPLAEQGNADAQTYLGVMYAGGQGVPQDYKTAVKWYKLAAEHGNALAQNYLGLMYRKGQGVPQNDKTAVKWYKLAAGQGYANAQNNLGFMYANGKGVPQDYILGHMWWNLAASSGNKDAIKNRDLLAKRMTPADISNAQKLVRKYVRKKYKGC